MPILRLAELRNPVLPAVTRRANRKAFDDGRKRTKAERSLGGIGLSKLSVPESQIRRCRRLASSNAWIFVVEVS
jgi:hypothetical protein